LLVEESMGMVAHTSSVSRYDARIACITRIPIFACE
jgi:hypothetical protein